MPFIKSHSNYVLKKRHQEIKDGTIWERDITTIGGLNQFSPGQTPIYKSSNFIITVRNEESVGNQYGTSKWKDNDENEVWTLQNVSALTSDEESQDSLKIVLKQDYYDLRDFAYYGSLTELFRCSIVDILDRFPGELYLSSGNPNVYYTTAQYVDGETIETSELLGDSGLTEVSNPFGINIHSLRRPLDAKPLKYFAEGGYEDYCVISDENSYPITNVEVVFYGYDENGHKSPIEDGVFEREALKGEQCALVTLTIDNGEQITIEVWVGDDCAPIYLYSGDTPYHIRPKETYLTAFYNGCDNFEKLLLNTKTEPIYKATFSVLKESDYGYYRELEDFVFPTSYGGYNIDASEYGFTDYTKRMVEIGTFYDERFTDNLYRSMTHEAIKNFDWTFTREFNQGDDEEYVRGGERIQKALRLFAREFDEIKSYIDAIKDINKVSYDERNNIPDYFLTDVASNEGWDVKLIYPYTRSNNSNSPFVQNTKLTVKPYSAEWVDKTLREGIFMTCCPGDETKENEQLCQYSDGTSPYYYISASGLGTNYYDECAGKLRNRMKPYEAEKEYTYTDVNNEFLRRLKINSRAIWRHKGTIEGIEMIMAMFGLKSKRWAESQPNNCLHDVNDWDYDITESVAISNRIKDEWDDEHQMYRIDWINSTKTIVYDNRNQSNYVQYGANTDGYIAYQGLPVSYRDVEVPIDYLPLSGGTMTGGIRYRGDLGPTSPNALFATDGTIGVVSALSEEAIIEATPSTLANGTRIQKRYIKSPIQTWANVDEGIGHTTERYLYPYFDKEEQLDGNPYYQMNGGWLSKLDKNRKSEDGNYFQFDVDDHIIYSKEPIYKETIRAIPCVNTINDLLTMNLSQLHDNTICYVSRIDENVIIVDGLPYEIQYEYNPSSDTPLSYISLIKGADFLQVGQNHFFDESFVVCGPNNTPITYDLTEIEQGYEIKAYFAIVNGAVANFSAMTSDGLYSVPTPSLIPSSDNDDVYSNYFVLDNPDYYDIIISGDNVNGWKRLTTSDPIYLHINTIENYYEGNNPHSGGQQYDDGQTYLDYYKRIFKHAAENSLFDERCYEDYYYTLDNEIYGTDSGIGFTIQTSSLNDSKVHYFGNYIDKANALHTYDIDSPLNKNDMAEGNNPYDVGGLTFEDGVTNQIINTKVITITLNRKPYMDTNDNTDLKYMDSTILHYLTQMVPSTAILKIEYQRC